MIFYIDNPSGVKKFPRNETIKRALQKAGYEYSNHYLPKSVWGQFRYYFSVLGEFKASSCIWVGVPGHYYLFVLKIFAKMFKKKIVFDFFISLYDQKVLDRGLVQKLSPYAKFLYAIDRWSMRLADVILIDTLEHRDFVSKFFTIPLPKIYVVLVGTDESIFTPRRRRTLQKPPQVYFHGNFIPLHGVPTIINALELLKEDEIMATFVGRGQEYPKVKKMVAQKKLERVSLKPNQPYHRLALYAGKADIFLAGPFGTSDKAGRVIPNKIYEAIAMNMPVIVADTKAVREVLDETCATFVPRGDSDALADAIRWVVANYPGAMEKADIAYQRFCSRASTDVIANKLTSILHHEKI